MSVRPRPSVVSSTAAACISAGIMFESDSILLAVVSLSRPATKLSNAGSQEDLGG